MAGAPQQIDLATLPLPQLNQLKQSLEEEISFLSSSQQQLKIAQNRFASSADTLKTLEASKEGQEIMVPLTSSLYIPGKLTDLPTVMVDIGTGYHVEKSLAEGEKYFGRRVDFLQKNIDEIGKTLVNKQGSYAVVAEVLSTRMREEMAAAR